MCSTRMKDLLLSLLKAIPDYFFTIGRMVAGPRTFVFDKVRSPDEEKTLGHALLTLALSTLVLLAMPGANKGGALSWISIVMNGLYKAIEIGLAGCILWVSWRAVARTTRFIDLVIAYAYLLSPLLLMWAVSEAIDDGGLRMIDPTLFTALSKNGPLWKEVYAIQFIGASDEELAKAFHTPFFLWLFGMMVLRVNLQFLWTVISWSAIRLFVGASWLRSFGAFLIAGFLFTFSVLILIPFQNAPRSSAFDSISKPSVALADHVESLWNTPARTGPAVILVLAVPRSCRRAFSSPTAAWPSP
jgi:hypothetical protein